MKVGKLTVEGSICVGLLIGLLLSLLWSQLDKVINPAMEETINY